MGDDGIDWGERNAAGVGDALAVLAAEMATAWKLPEHDVRGVWLALYRAALNDDHRYLPRQLRNPQRDGAPLGGRQWRKFRPRLAAVGLTVKGGAPCGARELRVQGAVVEIVLDALGLPRDDDAVDAILGAIDLPEHVALGHEAAGVAAVIAAEGAAALPSWRAVMEHMGLKFGPPTREGSVAVVGPGFSMDRQAFENAVSNARKRLRQAYRIAR
ncbi:MAG: hypothetical protein ACE37F_13140 [Nannocystaceae bacterium]|nr:hypothetical protein [bacterium]